VFFKPFFYGFLLASYTYYFWLNALNLLFLLYALYELWQLFFIIFIHLCSCAWWWSVTSTWARQHTSSLMHPSHATGWGRSTVPSSIASSSQTPCHGTASSCGIETLIAPDDEGECMGIELNIWEWCKVRVLPCLWCSFILYALFSLYTLYLILHFWVLGSTIYRAHISRRRGSDGGIWRPRLPEN
jgi:hypothetical protein